MINMELIKKFNTREEYNAYKLSDEYQVPNVCIIDDTDVEYNPQTYFWIEPLEDLTIKTPTSNIYYSLDLMTWTLLPNGNKQAIPFYSGKKIYFKSNIDPNYSPDQVFDISGHFNVGGDLTSLIEGDSFKEGITRSFINCIFRNHNVVDASELIIYPDRYIGIVGAFWNCKTLTRAPKIKKFDPAYSDASRSYFARSFESCQNLEQAPLIEASAINTYWLKNMFDKCEKLSLIKIFADSVSEFGSEVISLGQVASEGTLVTLVSDNLIKKSLPNGWTLRLYDKNLGKYRVRFVINNIKYYGDELTWEEWLNSEDGSSSYYVENNMIACYSGVVLYNGTPVLPTDKIIIDAAYTVGPIPESQLETTQSEE